MADVFANIPEDDIRGTIRRACERLHGLSQQAFDEMRARIAEELISSHGIAGLNAWNEDAPIWENEWRRVNARPVQGGQH